MRPLLRHLPRLPLLLLPACAARPAPEPTPLPTPTWLTHDLSPGQPLALTLLDHGPTAVLRDPMGCLVLQRPGQATTDCELPGELLLASLDAQAHPTSVTLTTPPSLHLPDADPVPLLPPGSAPDTHEIQPLVLATRGALRWVGGSTQLGDTLTPWVAQHDGALTWWTPDLNDPRVLVTALLPDTTDGWAAGRSLREDGTSALWVDRQHDDRPATLLPGDHPADSAPAFFTDGSRVWLYVGDSTDRAAVWQHLLSADPPVSKRIVLPVPRLRTTPLTLTPTATGHDLLVVVSAGQPVLVVLPRDATGEPSGEATLLPLGLDLQPAQLVASPEGGWWVLGRRLDRGQRVPALRYVTPTDGAAPGE